MAFKFHMPVSRPCEVRQEWTSMACSQLFQTFFNVNHFKLQTTRKTTQVGIQVRASQVRQPGLQDGDEASKVSKRSLAVIGLNMMCLSILGNPEAKADSEASGAFGKYVKRKKLDPLDTYIPPVILSKFQFQDLETKLSSDKPDYGDYRAILRSGPASSLRSNIRAVAQYASERADGKNASDAVRECIVSLEDLDSLLLRASRNDSSATIIKMKEKIDATIAALNKLLTTVPDPILKKCEAIAASYLMIDPPSDSSDQTDADTKLLESLL